MNDIARVAGVSQSTVSRILSGAELAVPVSASTRARVRDVAQQLGYRPNPHARGLRGASTMLIGAIVRDVTDPFFSVAIDALSLGARRHGYSVVLGHARAQADEALALAAVLEARQCDAILLVGDIDDQAVLRQDLRSVGLPVIELWHGSHARELPLVGVDNALGMSAVLEHLWSLGHRRIAFVGDPAKADVVERQQAYRTFMVARGRRPGDHDVRPVLNGPAGGGAALDALLQGPDRPTAVAAATDVLAFGLLHRAFERGLRIPGDISITGFDDIPLAACAAPALTTVRMPVTEMAEAAVALATARDGDGNDAAGAAARVFAPELVVRGSTGPAPMPGGGTMTAR